MSGSAAGDDLSQLLRWVQSGGEYDVVRRSPDGMVVVSLLTCTRGEEMARLTSADPALLAFLDEQGSAAAGA